MSDVLPHLRITTPTRATEPGRGFYQLEEDALYVQVGSFGPDRKYFSYLESETVRLDIDRSGRLMFIEVSTARRTWPVEKHLSPPKSVEPADIYWLDFRSTIGAPTIATNPGRTLLNLIFQNDKQSQSYYLADTVVIDITNDNQLSGIWITDIIDDRAGAEIAAFRKGMRPIKT